jgi:hypothetical protein
MNCAKQNPEMLAKRYFEAYNNRDFEEFLQLHSDTVKFNLGPDIQFTGKKELLGLIQYDSVMNARLTLNSVSVNGDTAFMEVTENNDWLENMGVGTLHYSPVIFIYDNGLILQKNANMTPESASRMGTALGKLVSWANQHEPDKLQSMMADGRFIYNAESARKVLELIKQYNEYNE